MKEFIVETDMDLSCVIEFTGAGDISFKPHGELIRCKDCMYYYPDPWGYGLCECRDYRRVNEKDFCSWADRKED